MADALELSYRAWEVQQQAKQKEQALQQLLRQQGQEAEHAQTFFGAGHVGEKEAQQIRQSQRQINQVRSLANGGGGNAPYMELNGVVYDDGSEQTPGVDPEMVKYAQLLGVNPKLAQIQAQRDSQQLRSQTTLDRERMRAATKSKDAEYQRFRKFAEQNNLPPEEIKAVTDKMLQDHAADTEPSPFTYYDYLDEQHDPAKKTAKAREITNAYLNGDHSRLHELVEPDPKTGKVDIKDLKAIDELIHGDSKVQVQRQKGIQDLLATAQQVATDPSNKNNVAIYNALKTQYTQRFGALPGSIPQYTKQGQFDLTQELGHIIGGANTNTQAPAAPVGPAPGPRAQRQFSVRQSDAPNAKQAIIEEARQQARATGVSVPVTDENGNLIGYANP